MEYWVIAPKANAAFVAAMVDALKVYTRPHDPARSLVCLDETSKQLVAETRTPLPARPGRPARYDHEYKRNGTASLFMLFAPLKGWREVKVTERRTTIDYAQVLKGLSDVHFAKAEKIVLVQDNLNTHSPASLYEAFTAAEARRLVERFEWHYTPQSTAAGSIWPSPSSLSCPINVSIGASPTGAASRARLPPVYSTATLTMSSRLTGALQPPMPASS
jgi:hypothetical protein